MDSPSSVNTRVIPAFLPTSPMAMFVAPDSGVTPKSYVGSISVQFDLHIHASSEIQLHQRIYGFVRWVDDVE